jgi:hypothetical protein
MEPEPWIGLVSAQSFAGIGPGEVAAKEYVLKSAREIGIAQNLMRPINIKSTLLMNMMTRVPFGRLNPADRRSGVGFNAEMDSRPPESAAKDATTAAIDLAKDVRGLAFADVHRRTLAIFTNSGAKPNDGQAWVLAFARMTMISFVGSVAHHGHSRAAIHSGTPR